MTIGQIVGSLPAFAEYDRNLLLDTTAACAQILDQEDGLDRSLELIQAALPPRLRETAYALACEVAAADGEIPPGIVTVRVAQEGRNWVVEIGDNGVGLPVKERSRLTEPYVTTREEGTGLGLAIVKKIMEDHGGNLRLSDRPGGGALATLILPRSAAPSGRAPVTESGSSPKAASHGA